MSLPLSGVLFSFSPLFFLFSLFASSQSFAAHSFTKSLFYVVPAPGDGMGHAQEPDVHPSVRQMSLPTVPFPGGMLVLL